MAGKGSDENRKEGKMKEKKEGTRDKKKNEEGDDLPQACSPSWFAHSPCDTKLLIASIVVGVIAATILASRVGPTEKFDKTAKYVSPNKKAPKNVMRSDEKDFAWQNRIGKLGYHDKVFTPSEVAYKEGGTLYLIVAGHVFDVSEAEKMYGKDSSYHGFIGKDCTRGFISGKFDDANCDDDISIFEDSQIYDVGKWLNFYFNHNTYKFKGVVEGLYFDGKGMPTPYFLEMITRMKKNEAQMQKDAAMDKKFPSCNIEWTAASGSRVWCSSRSGGVDRDWIGVPRQFTEEGKETRCACVHPSLLDDSRVEPYKDCTSNSFECRLKD